MNCLHLKQQLNLQFTKSSFRYFKEDPGPKMTKSQFNAVHIPRTKQELGLRVPATTAAAEAVRNGGQLFRLVVLVILMLSG